MSLASILSVPRLPSRSVSCRRGTLVIESTAFLPGARPMQALVGLDTPFDPAREQLKVLAGLEVNAKSVERT